jgi:dipeptidyl aminopeptidase/acylaminoacyl peptidase
MRLSTLLMTTLLPVLAAPLVPPAALAQSDATLYKRPPAAIASIVEAKPTPSISMDPTRQWMMLLHREAMPPVSELAAPMLRLAGRRINPDTNGPHGPRRFVAASLRKSLDNATKPIDLALPAGAGIGSPSWTRDGSRFTLAVTFADRIELWVGTTADASVRRVATNLNAASGGAFRWLQDGRLLVRLVNPARGPKPSEPVVPTGPVVQEATGKRAQVRTFQDLLKNSYDEDLFDWVMSTQLAIIDPATGTANNLGAPANWSALDPSPDGTLLLASRIVRPYSYAVPAGLFSEAYEVLDLHAGPSLGKVVKELRTFNVKDREQIPIEGVETGPRGFEWMENAPATILYAQALDGGDPKTKADFRDQLFAWDAPFTSDPRELFKLQFREAGTDYLEAVGGRHWMLASEYDRDRKWITTRIYDAANPAGTEPRVLADRSINDRYNDIGTPLRTLNQRGRSVIRVQQTASVPALLMSGAGATPEGDRPFLDLMPLDSLKPQRLWRSDAAGYESVVDVMADGSSFITSFESPEDYPNYFSRTLSLASPIEQTSAGPRAAITSFADPVPQVREVEKELIKYTRNDGVELSGTLYLPPGYDKDRDGPLPLFLWAYPLEFTDKSTAGQVSSTPTTFTRMGGSSHLCLVFAGYAVLDDATMPVIGDPETVNDTFVTQIVASAQAAIDKCAAMGVADPARVAVGGHSYGAFMTANLLAHSDLFRAGVARSGAYNRTLTPFGFQGERRTFWEAGDTYNKMSPFTYADKIKTPLLMIHGQIDNNPGTFPMQSERLFAAIKGLGGTAKLVMLPFESHGYAAMESALHVQAETVEWLDKYVKPAQTKPATPQPAAPATERNGQ